jgi:hypothetical protein
MRIFFNSPKKTQNPFKKAKQQMARAGAAALRWPMAWMA